MARPASACLAGPVPRPPRSIALALGLVVAAACAAEAPVAPSPPDASGAAPARDAGADATDAGAARPDTGPSATDAGPAADVGFGGSTDAGSPSDAAAPMADCRAIAAHPGWRLCEESAGSCRAVFEDGAGCAAVCAAAGLECAAVHEDRAGVCAPDLSRPALDCAAPTGHASDHCVCRVPGCAPRCDGRSCGDDGCGGRCGDCDPGLECREGACVPAVPAEDCTRYPFRADTLLAERLGHGRRARGGDPARVYRVSTLADGGAGSLRAALESTEPWWIVFDVEGRITHRSRVDVRSRKTIDGRGRDVTIEGSLRLEDVRDVIVSDVRLTNELEGHCTQAGDVVTVIGSGDADPRAYTSRDLWFHHVELFLGGDGLLDIRGGSDITLSWSHLRGHKKGLLHGRTREDRPAPGMRVTYHHDFFDRISLRGPQFLAGEAHFLNNYQFEWYEYGAAGLAGARFLSEANVYQARPGRFCVPRCPDPNPCGDDDLRVSKAGLVADWAGNGVGFVRSVGDLALEEAVLQENEPQRVPDVTDYPYVAEPATPALADRIRAEAGPRVRYCR